MPPVKISNPNYKALVKVVTTDDFIENVVAGFDPILQEVIEKRIRKYLPDLIEQSLLTRIQETLEIMKSLKREEE